nr:MAG TPA: hypothetical protein [Caudoviricetes sp.]
MPCIKISAFSRISGVSLLISAEIFSACCFCSSDIDLTSFGLFLAHTVAWILHIVKHYFILFPYFLIDIYSVL